MTSHTPPTTPRIQVIIPTSARTPSTSAQKRREEKEESPDILSSPFAPSIYSPPVKKKTPSTKARKLVLPKAAPPKIQESEVKEIPETPPDDDGSTRVPVNEEAKSSPSVRKHKKLILYGKSVKKVRVPSLEY